jgi:hypothetical protein
LARIRPLFGSLALLLAVLALPTLPATARAEDLYTYSVAALGGVGGSPDVNGANYGNGGYQVNFGLVTEPRTVLGLRIGKMSLNRPAVFGTLTGADLSYATIGGEYRLRQGFYDSGVYIALGAYNLRGREADGTRRDQTAAGAALGLTGEFTITRRLGVLVELSGHYADFSRRDIQFFAMGHAGLIVHF